MLSRKRCAKISGAEPHFRLPLTEDVDLASHIGILDLRYC